MKTTPNILILSLLIMLAFYACRDVDSFPIEPKIEYKGFGTILGVNNSDSLGILSIGFEDGDGDIGSENQENYFISIYQMVDGEMQKVELPDTSVNFNAIIPDLTPKGKYKGIKGTIDYLLELYNFLPLLESDTIAFETYIKDRAGHQSNVVMTPDLILN